MPLSAAASAIIQVVGIVLMSNDLPPNHSVRALVPRIPSISATHHGPDAGPIAGVEPHTAFLAFPASDYVSSHGWPPSGLEVVQGMLYVTLDGEQVTIRGQHPTDALSHTASAARLQIGDTAPAFTPAPAPTMSLPHLKSQCCTGVHELRQEFQPPYTGAAAVVEFGTAGSVQASSCTAFKGRIDTHVTIPNDGTITIAATKGGKTKEIVLKGTSREIYLTNFPSSFFDPAMPQHNMGMPHYEVYFLMTDAPKSCDWSQCTRPSNLPACSATATTYWREGFPSGTTTISGYPRFDVECSNSQWP